MKTKIQKINDCLGKIDLENKNDFELKDFVEWKYKEELFRLLTSNGISKEELKHSSIQKIIFILLGVRLNRILLNNFEIEKISKDFFYKRFLEDLKIGNTIKVIENWKNVVKEYKKFLEENIKTSLLSKGIDANDYIIDGMVTNYIKKDYLDKFYLIFADIILNEIYSKGKFYQKIIFFLRLYFSGYSISIGIKKYKLPKLKLFTEKSRRNNYYDNNNDKYDVNVQINKLTFVLRHYNTKVDNYESLLKKINIHEQDKQEIIQKKIVTLENIDFYEERLKKIIIEKDNIQDKIKKLEKNLENNFTLNLISLFKKNKELNNLKEKYKKILLEKGKIKRWLLDAKDKIKVFDEKIKNLNSKIKVLEQEVEKIKKQINKEKEIIDQIKIKLKNQLKKPPIEY